MGSVQILFFTSICMKKKKKKKKTIYNEFLRLLGQVGRGGGGPMYTGGGGGIWAIEIAWSWVVTNKQNKSEKDSQPY